MTSNDVVKAFTLFIIIVWNCVYVYWRPVIWPDHYLTIDEGLLLLFGSNTVLYSWGPYWPIVVFNDYVDVADYLTVMTADFSIGRDYCIIINWRT